MCRNNVKYKGKCESLERTQLALAERINTHTEGKILQDIKIPKLSLYCIESPTEPTSYLLESSVCLIAQGVKRVLLGKDVYVYNSHNYLVTSVVVPVVTQIIEAIREKAYLGLRFELNQKISFD